MKVVTREMMIFVMIRALKVIIHVLGPQKYVIVFEVNLKLLSCSLQVSLALKLHVPLKSDAPHPLDLFLDLNFWSQ